MQFNKLELVLAVMTERQAFCWRAYLGGCSLKEIAGKGGLSRQAVKKHLKRGIRRARKRLFVLNIPSVFKGDVIDA